jgi:hypothetical protein
LNAHLHAVRRLALAAGFVGALSLAARTVSAQQAPAPSASVSGLAYTQFSYNDFPTAGVHLNGFSVQRAYINVIGRFGEIVTRVTADVAPAAVGNQLYRLKYAYAAYTPTGSALTYKMGLIHTPFLDFEEALWDYRVQGSMALDRNGYLTSSDAGVGIDGKWNSDAVNGQLTLVNGEGYSGGTGDNRKDLEARVSARLSPTDDGSRVGGIRLTGYAGFGKMTGGGSRDVYLGMLSYRSNQFTLAGEFASTKGNLAATTTATGRVISAFGVYHFTASKAAVIARVDIVDPNTSVANDKQTRLIGGLSYQLSPNVRLLADLENLSFEAGTTAHNTALFQTQFTF